MSTEADLRALLLEHARRRAARDSAELRIPTMSPGHSEIMSLAVPT
jgi:hypothetical protein